LFDLHQGMVTNEHQYVTKMALSASMGGLWGDFITIFWILQYLQRPIYIWNKISKCICFDVTWIFNSSLYIECIIFNILKQYVNGLFRFLFAFQVNDFKVSIDLDDFSSFF
jgi:hypothetical protein